MYDNLKSDICSEVPKTVSDDGCRYILSRRFHRSRISERRRCEYYSNDSGKSVGTEPLTTTSGIHSWRPAACMAYPLGFCRCRISIPELCAAPSTWGREVRVWSDDIQVYGSLPVSVSRDAWFFSLYAQFSRFPIVFTQIESRYDNTIQVW